MFPRTLVIVVFLAAQTALLGWLAARDRTPTRQFAWTTVAVPGPTPAPIIAAPPTPVAPAAPPATIRPSCPPMRTDAAPLPKRHELPRGVNHVTTSWTNAGWLAAWDETRVLVSMDGGLSFDQVLDGPGTVRDVTFDCFGHPIVLRTGNAVGIRDHEREQWRSVPGMRTDENAPSALIGGGPDVLVVGVSDLETWHASLAVSADLGASWWYRDLVDYWETSAVTGHQDADGAIDVAITTADCMSDPTTWLRISPEGKVARDELGDVGTIQLYEGFAIVHGNGTQWKRFGDKDWRDVDGVTEGTRMVLANGPLARVVVGDAIYTVANGRGKPLRPWTYDEASVDRAGRLWGIDETKDGEDAWLVMQPGTRAKIPPAPEWNGNE